MGKHTVQVIKCVCIKVHVYVLAEEGVKASMPVWGRRRQRKRVGGGEGEGEKEKMRYSIISSGYKNHHLNKDCNLLATPMTSKSS